MSGDNEKGGAATSAKKFIARQFKISGKSSSKKRREKNQTLDPLNPENHDQPGYNFGDAGEKKRTRAKIRQNGNWIVVKNQFLGPPSEHKSRSLKASKARVWRALVAEFFATALFIFFATGAVVVSLRFDPTGGAVANLIVDFTQAFALSIAIYYSANVSGGHINPAVTLSFLLVGRMRFLVAILYWISQIVGAIVGSALLHAIIPDNERGNLGSTTLAPGYSRGRGVLLEAILTFTLVSTVYATAIDRIGFGKGAPFAIGLSIFIDLIIGWKLTGASMNPARSIGPAIISNTWDSHWVYWVGPFIGAIVGAYIYDFILISRPDNKNPFSAGTRMETEGRPIIAVPAQELAPEDNAADSLSDVNPTNNTQEATDKPSSDKSPSVRSPSVKSVSSAIPEVPAV